MLFRMMRSDWWLELGCVSLSDVRECDGDDEQTTQLNEERKWVAESRLFNYILLHIVATLDGESIVCSGAACNRTLELLGTKIGGRDGC